MDHIPPMEKLKAAVENQTRKNNAKRVEILCRTFPDKLNADRIAEYLASEIPEHLPEQDDGTLNLLAMWISDATLGMTDFRLDIEGESRIKEEVENLLEATTENRQLFTEAYKSGHAGRLMLMDVAGALRAMAIVYEEYVGTPAAPYAEKKFIDTIESSLDAVGLDAPPELAGLFDTALQEVKLFFRSKSGSTQYELTAAEAREKVARRNEIEPSLSKAVPLVKNLIREVLKPTANGKLPLAVN